MTREQLAKQKGQIQSWIWTYNDRRRRTKANTNKILYRIRLKLSDWKRAMRNVEKRQADFDKIIEVEKSVVQFFGVAIRGKNGRWQPVEVHTAKGVYYKYCIENGHKASDAMSQIKATHHNQAVRYRRSFTAAYSKDQLLRMVWLNFKEFHLQRVSGLKK